MKKAMNFNGFTTVSVKGNYYEIHFWYMSKDYAMNKVNSSNLNKKGGLI